MSAIWSLSTPISSKQHLMGKSVETPPRNANDRSKLTSLTCSPSDAAAPHSVPKMVQTKFNELS